jgi:hydrogenase nickel incorporation protein HypA/HybF
MHEMSICQSILRTLEEQALLQHFSRVERVCLEIGPFAGVEVDALRFGFDVIMRDSLAAGARLEIVESAGEALCQSCAATVPVTQRFDPCPRCGSHQLRITGGEELRIKELEVT